jgi:hypothetical protein
MAGQPRDNLSAALQHLRRQAGDPSFRKIAKATSYSHTTVAEAMTGARRVSWEAIQQIVSYLGGDVDEAKQLWLAARELEAPLPPVGEPHLSAPSEHRIQSDSPSAMGYRPGSTASLSSDSVEAIWDRTRSAWNFLIPPHLAPTVMKELVQEEHPDDPS